MGDLREHDPSPSNVAPSAPYVAIELLPLLEKEAKERQRLSQGRGKKVSQKNCPTFSENGGRASQIAARVMKTNAAYVKAIKAVRQDAPELVEEVRSGKLTVPEARELARAPASIRRKVLGVLGKGGPRRKVSRMIREAIIAGQEGIGKTIRQHQRHGRRPGHPARRHEAPAEAA